MENEAKLAVIEEKINNIQTQIHRFVSHLESEQRVTGNISKRVDVAQTIIDELKRTNEVYDKILRNGGVGLSVRVDRLEKSSEGNKARVFMFMSIVSVLISITIMIIQILK